MTANEKRLAVYFLKQASDEYANHGCNDLSREVLAMLSASEKAQFAKEYGEWNGDPENERKFEHLGDSSVMAFLAHKLELEIAN